jgi:hypothetical protein
VLGQRSEQVSVITFANVDVDNFCSMLMRDRNPRYSQRQNSPAYQEYEVPGFERIEAVGPPNYRYDGSIWQVETN